MIDQQRVSNPRMDLLPALPPLVPRLTSKSIGRDVGALATVEPQVAVARKLVRATAPVAPEQSSRLGDDHIVGEPEGPVRLRPGAHDRVVGIPGQQVVANEVVAAVVLVESGIGTTGGDVVLNDNAGAAFIGVQRPSAVAVTLDVAEDVVADHRAGLGPEGCRNRPCRSSAPAPPVRPSCIR